MDILAADCGHDAIPGDGQIERWDQLWSTWDWSRRAATSSELVSGSSVTMSYTFGSCEYGYVAAVFRDAAGATPTPTLTPSASPTATPPVPTPPSGQIWRSYYFAGSQRIALRVAGDPVQANNGVFYLLADHLGSTNVVVDEDGDIVGELRYKAWGETRYASGSPNTDYRYTGQREEAGIGLYYYHARWYDPALGRFGQADSITLGVGNPLAWDRYLYTSDNPLRFIDPSGHMRDEGCGMGGSGQCATKSQYNSTIDTPSDDSGGSQDEGHAKSSNGRVTATPLLLDDYLQGWANFNMAWAIAGSPHANLIYRYGAGGYIALWGGAHVGFLIGAAALGCAALSAGCATAIEGTLGIGAAASADGDPTNEMQAGTNTVYRVVEGSKTIYVGITRDFQTRASYWSNQNGWQIQPISGLYKALSRLDARAVEQVLIEHFGIDNLANKINSIAASNPIYTDAIQRGRDILNARGFTR
jgi:RHS repeat-associated protein